MKSNPALPGGLLTGKPTWSNAFRAFRHVGFFSCFTLARAVAMLFPRQWAPASAEQVVYVDDQPMFVQIAEGLGIRGIRHTDYQSTCEKLASFGLHNAEKEQ